jgi:hypothetical protein
MHRCPKLWTIPSNVSSVIDLEVGSPSTSGPSNGWRSSWPRGHKAIKANLKRGASTLAMHETLKVLMAE